MLEKEIDPVCGMTINPFEALAQTSCEGQIYYFCSDECRSKFKRDPEKYVKREPERQSQH